MGILRRKLVRIAVAAVAAFGFGAAIVAPTGVSASTVLNAAAWGYGYDYAHNHSNASPHTTFNYDTGGSSVLIVTDRGGSFSTTEARGAIEFNISSFTNPLAIATLNLTKDFANFTSAVTFSVYGDASWRANGAINSSDFYTGPNFVGSFSYFNEAVVNFDVTAFINSKIALTEDYVLLQIIQTTGFQNRFAMLNNGTNGQAPPTLSLEVAAVPLPAALPLYGSGLAIMGFIGWRRRRRAIALARA